MAMILCIVGILTIIGGLVTGIMTAIALEGFVYAIVSVISGILGSVIFFALAEVLNRQEKILFRLDSFETNQNKKVSVLLGGTAKKRCAKCEREVDADYSSCPFCAGKEFY